MTKKSNERGLSSSAGLVTYYDADDKTSPHVAPAAVLIAALVIGVIVYILGVVF